MSKTRRPGLTTCTVDGEVVILDRAAGYVHQLNATASQIWLACDGRNSMEDIAAQIVERFENTPEAVLRDIQGALADLERLGLLLEGEPVEQCNGNSAAGHGASS